MWQADKLENCRGCIRLANLLWRNDSLEGITPTPRLCLFPPYYYYNNSIKLGTGDQGKLSFEHLSPKKQCPVLAARIDNTCNTKCRVDCENRYYNMGLRTEINPVTLATNELKAIIKITHSQMPDQVIEHIPEMSFIDLLSNIGGLVGLWLGWSILSFINLSLHIF